MVGPHASVFFHSTAELGEHHNGDFIRMPEAFEVFHKPAHRVGGVHEQTAVEIRLLHVRVERVALIRDVVQPRRHPGVDERRHSLEVAAQPAAHPVVHRCVIAGRGLANEVGAFGGVLGGGRKKLQHRVRCHSRPAESGKHLLLAVGAVAAETGRVVEDQR